jgi:ACS family hexuronate transporter-like MFS transporter
MAIETRASNQVSQPVGNYRWVICGLLFFATTVNYMDRQVVSYLKEFFCKSTEMGGFGWTNSQYSYLISFFTGIYAVGTIFTGRLIDKIGTKIGLALSFIAWSIFGILNAFVGSLVSMHIAIRSLFAVSESGNFPASNKSVAEWFPKRERAMATAVFNAGSNFGAMLAALFVPWCLIYFGEQHGWKMAFILTGTIGFLWLIFWFWFYETPAKQKRLMKPEYDYLHIDDDVVSGEQSGAGAEQLSWWRLFRYRQLWAFFAGKFMTDGIWWFYLFWLPDYLIKQFNMTTKQIMMPTFIVYGVAIVGSIYASSIPRTLVNRGMPVYKARMLTMLIIALFPLAVLATQYFGDVARFGNLAVILAVAMICIGTTAHQAWSANLFTTVSDMFPRKAVASVTGIGTTAGGIGGVIVQLVAGRLTDAFISHPQTAYFIMFIICALSYLIAWAIIKALVPRHKPITDL